MVGKSRSNQVREMAEMGYSHECSSVAALAAVAVLAAVAAFSVLAATAQFLLP